MGFINVTRSLNFTWENKPEQTNHTKTSCSASIIILFSCWGFCCEIVYLCSAPAIQELCQYWSSSAQLSPTSSVKTPSEPCSSCKLLISWFLQRFSRWGRNTGLGLLHSGSPASRLPQWGQESNRQRRVTYPVSTTQDRELPANTELLNKQAKKQATGWRAEHSVDWNWASPSHTGQHSLPHEQAPPYTAGSSPWARHGVVQNNPK